MPNTSLKLPPGMVKPGTVYDARGRWFDGNLVRWYSGTLRAIGGWSQLDLSVPEQAPLELGEPVRGMLDWRDNVQQPVLALGTPSKLWMYRGGALYDITPVDLTAGDANALKLEGQYGHGPYGTGAFGEGLTGGLAVEEATSWQLDTFGEWLLACSSKDRRILLCDDPTGAKLAEPLSNAPTQNRGVVVTPERFVVALGADGNDRKIAWSDQENPEVWAADSTNQAGDFTITTKGGIMAGRKGSNETLIWTDVDLWRMRFIGGDFVYSVTRVASNCGSPSRWGMAEVDGKAYWMGEKSFFQYDGYVQPLASDVAEHVFNSINKAQISKVTCYPRAQFGEITWHYPSSGSTECDRYVTFNYQGGFWFTGTLERTSGTDSSVFGFPVAADSAGRVYQHEINHGEYLDVDGVELVPYIECGPIEIGQGEHTMNVHQIIPDANTLGAVQAYLYSSIENMKAETLNGPYSLSAPTPARLVARQLRLRLEWLQSGGTVGTFKLDVTPGSRR